MHNESEHPRDASGKWREKPHGAADVDLSAGVSTTLDMSDIHAFAIEGEQLSVDGQLLAGDYGDDTYPLVKSLRTVASAMDTPSGEAGPIDGDDGSVVRAAWTQDSLDISRTSAAGVTDTFHLTGDCDPRELGARFGLDLSNVVCPDDDDDDDWDDWDDWDDDDWDEEQDAVQLPADPQVSIDADRISVGGHTLEGDHDPVTVLNMLDNAQGWDSSGDSGVFSVAGRGGAKLEVAWKNGETRLDVTDVYWHMDSVSVPTGPRETLEAMSSSMRRALGVSS